MSIAAIILIIIGAILALIVILGLVINKDMLIEHSVIIKKPKQEVFDYIKFLKNQDNYSVWNQMDPDMKKEYRGTDGTVGFVYAWESFKDKNAGKGEQEIKAINEGESLEFELRFIKPWESIAKVIMRTESLGPNETKVSWSFLSKMPFPMNVVKGMFAKMLGKDLLKGLQNLKVVMEK
jgi:hypothetical protein